MNLPAKPETLQRRLEVLERLVSLSVDLHNFNSGIQRLHDISVVQWLVLKKIVEQPGLSAGTLAEISRVQPSTLTPTIGRLDAMGLIHIQERPSDLRRKFLVASWKGLACSRRTEAAFAEAFEDGDLEVDGKAFEAIRNLTKRLLEDAAPVLSAR